MHYGFTLAGRGPFAQTDALSTIAKHGEALGFDSLCTGDHIVVPRHITSRYPYTESGAFPGSGSGEYLEQLTVLSFLAGQTQRIQLVTSCHRLRSVGRLRTNICRSSKNCGRARTRRSRDNTVSLTISIFSPNPCNNPIRPSGSGVRAAAPCSAPPAMPMVGTRLPPIPNSPWPLRNSYRPGWHGWQPSPRSKVGRWMSSILCIAYTITACSRQQAPNGGPFTARQTKSPRISANSKPWALPIWCLTSCGKAATWMKC